MLVFIEYPIWELLLYVGIYRISNMGITIVRMLVFIEYPIWELLYIQYGIRYRNTNSMLVFIDYYPI